VDVIFQAENENVGVTAIQLRLLRDLAWLQVHVARAGSVSNHLDLTFSWPPDTKIQAVRNATCPLHL